MLALPRQAFSIRLLRLDSGDKAASVPNFRRDSELSLASLPGGIRIVGSIEPFGSRDPACAVQAIESVVRQHPDPPGEGASASIACAPLQLTQVMPIANG